MPRRLLRRYMPDHGMLRKHRLLRVFGKQLHDPNIWHLNRRSVAGGLGIGVFVAFIPLPLQMVIAAALALWWRANLPLSVAAVWITNPFTMPPIFFISYQFGVWLLTTWPFNVLVRLSPADDWFLHSLGAYGGPLLLGSLVLGLCAGLLTFTVVRLIWRWHVVVANRRRQQGRRVEPRGQS
ncbi:MAG: DUF2062 domain-containing protein [Candidatus Competibacterales bacterium]|nr:DUF2062 domain-containing protein [Candidatus Competibacterales bacterium]